ncbi:hypothetical protein EV2_007158 [Malus domestica]
MEGAKWWYSEGGQSPPLSMNLAIRKLLTSIFLAVAATAGNNIRKILQKKGTVILPPLSFKLKGFLHREENCFVYVSLKLSELPQYLLYAIWCTQVVFDVLVGGSKLAMSTPTRKRLMRDFKRLQQNPPARISRVPQDGNVMLSTRPFIQVRMRNTDVFFILRCMFGCKSYGVNFLL